MAEKQVRAGASSGTQESQPDTPCGTQKSRRSGRISKEVPILIFGNDVEGRVFTEETHTVVLSLHGAGIVSSHGLIPEQELVLRLRDANREAEVRVVGELGQQDGLHTYGVAFLDEELDFWQEEFPPPPQWCERPVLLALECGGCRRVVELANGDYEYDICAVHGGLTRYCNDCGMLTVWRQPTEVMRTGPRVSGGGMKTAPFTKDASLEARGKQDKPYKTQGKPGAGSVATQREAEVVESVILPIAEPTETGEVERRARVRAKVNFFACVRSKMFKEEIVTCIDMSRGGVSFRSRNFYEQGTIIEIAVPFSPEAREAPAIFVRGRIAHVREMPGGEMWRCGVEFLR